jgi:hypothetical protein
MTQKQKDEDVDGITRNHIEQVENIGRAIVELSTVDFPISTVDEAVLNEAENIIETLRYHDEEWAAAWDQTHQIMEQYNSHVSIDIHEQDRFMIDLTTETDHTILSVTVKPRQGKCNLFAEYENGRGWDVFYEGTSSNVDVLDIGRKVASTQLTLIASTTESPAQVLDLWQTKLSPRRWTQSHWGDTRGVGRQSVCNQVREAKEKLNYDTL